MPDRIVGVGYRTLPPRDRRAFAPWAIARTALTLAWRRKATKLALLPCGAAFLIHGAWLVMQVFVQRYSRMQYGLPMGPQHVLGEAQEVLAAFLLSQFFTTAFLMAIVSAGLVAEDRRAGALDLYFARPLKVREYALGKLLAAFCIPALTIIVPTFLLWLSGLGMAPEELRPGLWGLLLPALVGALTSSLLLTCMIVGMSALGERGRTVGIAFIALLGILAVLGESLPHAGHAWAGYLAPARDLRTLVRALLPSEVSLAGIWVAREGVLFNRGVLPSVLALLGFCVAGLGALSWRLRREVSA